jgi:glycosyltransferase involved in cell wall biosynthesis
VSRATAAQFPASDRVRVLHGGLWGNSRRAPCVAARAAPGLDTEIPVIAVLGRVPDWKGQDLLDRALAETTLADRSAVALIAGEAWPGAGDRAPDLEDLASRLGVAGRVRVLGFRDDVETVFGAADVIAVLSTAPDPLPGAAVEAAAAGCAVVASDQDGLPEIIRDGETGLLVRRGDLRALAGACAALLATPRGASAWAWRRRPTCGGASHRALEAGLRELYASVSRS